MGGSNSKLPSIPKAATVPKAIAVSGNPSMNKKAEKAPPSDDAMKKPTAAMGTSLDAEPFEISRQILSPHSFPSADAARVPPISEKKKSYAEVVMRAADSFLQECRKEGLESCHGMLHADGSRKLSDLSSTSVGELKAMGLKPEDVSKLSKYCHSGAAINKSIPMAIQAFQIPFERIDFEMKPICAKRS